MLLLRLTLAALFLDASLAGVVLPEPMELPPGLLIGAGGSSFQMDGGWDADGKSESSIDYIFHNGNLSHLGFNDPHATDVAADSYHRYKEDMAAAAELKLQVYRFSFSWPRILPDGDASKPNKAGVDFYHNLIDEMHKLNIEPFATIYHFEHPQIFEDQFKGWQNSKMVDKFREYSAFLFKEFGSKVKLWTTINEPNVVCTYFVNLTLEAGLGKEEDFDTFQCVHNIVLAHGHAYRAFKEAGTPGQLGCNNWFQVGHPHTTSEEDLYASELYNEVHHGIFMHPLVHGDYPETLKQVIGHVLYNFTDEEKGILKGSTDFISINNYGSCTVRYKNLTEPGTWIARSGPEVVISMFIKDIPVISYKYTNSKEEETVDLPGEEITPTAIRRALVWTWEQYKLPIIVSENGIGLQNDSNQMRAAYHSQFIRSMVAAVNEVGVKVIAYCVWSLIDNFEWSDRGFDTKYALVHVDYDHGSLKRTVKPVSKELFVGMAETRLVPYIEQPDVPTSSGLTSYSSALVLLLTAFATLHAYFVSIKQIF